jgi:integrase
MDTRNRISFSFYIKRTKPLKSGEVPIYVKIKANDTQDEIATLRSIHPDKWCTTKNGALGTSKEAREFNDSLMHIRFVLQDHVKLLIENGQEITARSIKNSYMGIISNDKKVIALFEIHNNDIRSLTGKGKDFAPATLQRYETCKLHLSNYIKEKYKVNDMPISKVNPDLIKGFELYLKTVRNCGHNSAVQYVKNFKKIVDNAFQNGWLKNDPFVKIKLRQKKVERGFLSLDELTQIMNKNFSIERLNYVKDVFLFGCFTGLAYSDLKSLTLQNLVKDENGKMWIHTHRKKTDTISHIPLIPVALKIIEKYQNNPHCQTFNILLPVYSNQKLNAYLKEIADACGIEKKLSTHIARHTFATTVTLNNDIPIESVSKMLGHSSINMTQHYAKLLDKKVAKDMEKLQDIFAYKKPYFPFNFSLN